DVLCSAHGFRDRKQDRGGCRVPVVDSGGGGILPVGAVAVSVGMARVAFLPVLRVLLSRRRDWPPGRRPAERPELSPDAERVGAEPARWRSAISARTDLPATPPV